MVLKAALSAGYDAVGFDVDPLAVLMSTVWTSAGAPGLSQEAEAVVREAKRLRSFSLSWIDQDKSTLEFTSFWFAPRQREELRRLAYVLNKRPVDSLSNALRLSLSRIIVTKSKGASLASDVSHSRPHRTKTDNDYDVYAGFVGATRVIDRALDSTATPSIARVSMGDARNLSSVQSESVGMVVTSPPYLNAIDYLRGHRLALVWLGHSIGSLRTIRSGSIGAERRAEESITGSALEELGKELGLHELSPRLKGMLTRYLVDMDAMTGEVARVLRPGADVVLVVGNSTIRGEYADNSLFATKAAEKNGLRLVDRSEREIPESKRYLPTPKASQLSTLSKRMRKEVIVTLRK
jgi:hypothetical protein